MEKQGNKIKAILLAGLVGVGSSVAYADGWDFGDDATGKLHIGGAVRARYDYVDYPTGGCSAGLVGNTCNPNASFSGLGLDTIRLDVKYTSPSWLGYLQYRWYGGGARAGGYDAFNGYHHIGDFNTLVDAWAGYKFGAADQVHVGLNPIPFGVGQFWGNTFYLGIANPLGLEDVHNIGVKYIHDADGLNLQAGFYPRDGGSYHGKDPKYGGSGDRFTVNLDNGYGVTNNKEENMFIGRAAYTFKHGAKDSTEVGLSAWHSKVRNEITNEDGTRKAFAVHAKTQLGSLGLMAQAARNDISREAVATTGYAAGSVYVGGFDGSFRIAPKGNVYVAEVNYAVDGKFGYISGVMPYINYSTYKKSENGFASSTRVIPGVQFSYEKLYVYAEMHYGKNDPYVGQSYDSALAEGGGVDRDKWQKAFYMNIGYYF
jgi:hypothetical protein